MSQFIARRDRWGNPLALWVVAGMCFVLPLFLWGNLSVRIQNNVQKWIPDRLPEQQTAQWYTRHFPIDDIVLVTWDGSNLADPRADRLTEKIRGKPDASGKCRGKSKLIDHVISPRDLISGMQRCDLSHEEAIERLSGLMIGAGPLRVRLTEVGRARREKVIELIRTSVHQSLGIEVSVANAVSSSLSSADQSIPESPAGLAIAGDVERDAGATVGEGAAGTPTESTGSAGRPVEGPPVPAHDLTVTWPGMHWDAAKKAALSDFLRQVRFPSSSREAAANLVDDCFQRPGAPVALAIYLSEAGRADRTAAIRDIVALAESAGIPANAVHLAGKPVVTAALDSTIVGPVRESKLSFAQIPLQPGVLLTALVGVVVAFWMLRSVRLTAIVAGLSCFTTLATAALVPFAHGGIDLYLMIVLTLTYVTSLIFGVGIVKGWQRESADADAGRGVKRATSAILLTGATLAISDASLAASSLAPIRQFGLLAVTGTLLSLAVMLLGLPAALTILASRPLPSGGIVNSAWLLLARWIGSRHRIITAIALVVLSSGAWGLTKYRTESRVIRQFSEDSRTLRDYEFIEDHLAGVLPVDVIIRFDRESQQQLKFLQRSDVVRKIEAEIRELPEISGALSLADFLPTVGAPGDHANVRERARFNAASRTIESRVKGDDRVAATPLLAIAEDSTEFNAEGDELWRITAQAAMMSAVDYGELRGRIDDICSNSLRGISGNTADKVLPVGQDRSYHPGASHVITGDIAIFVATQTELRLSLRRCLAIAIAGLTVISMVVLRHVGAGVLAMLPGLLAVGAVSGIATWYGLSLDIGSALAAPLALAIACDATLRLVGGFCDGIRERKGRIHALGLALSNGGATVCQITFIASTGLLTLCCSDLVLVSRFGALLAALLVVCCVGNLVLTPALLAGALGSMIEASVQPFDHHDDDRPAKMDAPSATPPHIPQESVPGKPHITQRGVRIRRID